MATVARTPALVDVRNRQTAMVNVVTEASEILALDRVDDPEIVTRLTAIRDQYAALIAADDELLSVDQREFELSLASRTDAEMDGKWSLLTYFLAFLHDKEDIEAGRFGDQPERAEAAAAALELVLDVLFAFDEHDAPEKFRSFARAKRHVKVINDSLDAHLAYNGEFA